jgi:hypothetical protein
VADQVEKARTSRRVPHLLQKRQTLIRTSIEAAQIKNRKYAIGNCHGNAASSILVIEAISKDSGFLVELFRT